MRASCNNAITSQGGWRFAPLYHRAVIFKAKQSTAVKHLLMKQHFAHGCVRRLFWMLPTRLHSALPATMEVVMSDKTTLALKLRTAFGQGWLHVVWHPVAGRICISGPPERGAVSEAFTYGEQVHSALAGLVLVDVQMPQAWERVVQLQFGTRPGEAPSYMLWCEIMARYSNVILTRASGEILACALQVGGMMSSHRQLQAGGSYQMPPQLTGIPADSCKSMEEWKETVCRAALLAVAYRQATATGTATAIGSPQPSSSPALSADNTSSEQSNGNNTRSAGTSSSSSSSRASAMQEKAAAAASSSGRLIDGCIRAFQGVSPSLVEELCWQAGVPATTTVDSLSEQQWGSLHQQWTAWLGRLHSGTFTATLDSTGHRYSVFGSYSQQHESVFTMLEEYYGALQGSELHSQLHQQLTASVAAALKRLRSKVHAFNQQLADAARAEDVQRQADMITANLYRIKAGMSEVGVEDWENGQPITLKLDPLKAPVEVAEGLYKKARKLRRAVDAVSPLLEAAASDIAYLEELEENLAQLKQYTEPADLKALREVQEELVQQQYLKAPPEVALAAKGAAKGRKASRKAAQQSAGSAASSNSSSSRFRQFLSPNGFQVLVGRNNRQNDELSHQVAKENDIWMHVRGMPGSHTVIRVPAGKSPADQDLQFAADLAAFFSKGRNSGKADVIVARAAHLKKPKGAKPGQVLVTKEMCNVVARPGNSAAAVMGDGQQRCCCDGRWILGDG